MAKINMNSIDMQVNNFRLQQAPENISVLTTKEDQLNLIKINQTPYIIISNKMLKYDRDANKLTEVKGFENPGEGLILKSQIMNNVLSSNKTQFYTMTSTEIRIFEVVDDLTVKLVQTISEIKDVNLLTSTYDAGYFYATALNKLFIIDTTEPSNFQIYRTTVNGSCNYIEKFQTSLHLGCTYDKLYYIVEFFTISNQVALNRFYSNEDIEGRAMVRRIGMGKMAILSDNDLRITNYAINRNTLIETDEPQP